MAPARNDTTFFATGPRGTESLLAAELRDIGASSIRPGNGGVTFSGSLGTAYRACLWSRVASRILLPIARFSAAGPEELYAAIRRIPWADHIPAQGTLAVDFGSRDSAITHTHFGALKVKDAVVDQFRDSKGIRPSVDTAIPDVRINVFGHRNRYRVSIDLSGAPLHRRGYREQGVEAPMKENLAAAILLLADWPRIAEGGGALVDPMCGSGTLPIEAALMAGDMAPGMLRTHWGFNRWLPNEPELWNELLMEAAARREAGIRKIPPVFGFDANPRAVAAARENARRAGLGDRLTIGRKDLSRQVPGADVSPGLFILNPPYGERLGEEHSLGDLYDLIGAVIRERFSAWNAAVFTGNAELSHRLGLFPSRVETLYNGPLACTLSLVEAAEPEGPSRVPVESETGAPGHMLANRLRKNLKRLDRWVRRNSITCYRVYDGDIPEYAFAVDLYEGRQRWLHVQEYQAPDTVDPTAALLRRQQALAVIPSAFDLPPSRVVFKVRKRQKGSSQYGRFDSSKSFQEITEGGLRFLVNLSDYLDTGLFLDHRLTRGIIREMARGKSFLNLFGYTGTATVYAASGGARSTTTVDMSRTYLEWARRNMEINGFGGPEHRFVKGDCLKWLEEQASHRRRQDYDLIFLDPPTFSTSKGMSETLDIRRDHVRLIGSAADLLSPGGVMIFSTNARTFRLDEKLLGGFRIEDITRRTIPEDFSRTPRIHRCWTIRR